MKKKFQMIALKMAAVNTGNISNNIAIIETTNKRMSATTV